MELLQTRIKRGMDFLLEGVIREGTGIGLSKVIVHKEETEGQADKEKHLQKGIIVRAGHLVRIEIQEKMTEGEEIEVSKDKEIQNHQREQEMTREDKKDLQVGQKEVQ